MKENERKQVIEGVKQILGEKNSLKQKYSELKKLSKEPLVKQYLELVNDVNIQEEKLKQYDSLEKIINYEFSSVLRRYRKDIALTPCQHEIWLYDGSYYLLKDFLNEHDHEIKEYLENATFEYVNYSFLYNRYICLECGKKIETKNWEQFENCNYVLKNQDKQTNLGTKYYIDKYYQLLYRNNIIKSQKLIIEEFNQNKVKIKQK